MAKAKIKTVNHVLDVAVDFGGLSIGDQSARLGVVIERAQLNLLAADEIFCGHRLTGQVVLGDEDGKQGTLIDDLHESVTGTFDVRRLSVSPKQYGIGLTFSLNDIDVAVLAKFAKASGRLRVETVAELQDEIPTAEEADE